jgi:hypothetical protein
MDPTGHWDVAKGDNNLNPDAKAKMISLTNAYYAAQTKMERDAIAAAATAMRADKSNYASSAPSVVDIRTVNTIASNLNAAAAKNNGTVTKEANYSSQANLSTISTSKPAASTTITTTTFKNVSIGVTSSIVVAGTGVAGNVSYATTVKPTNLPNGTNDAQAVHQGTGGQYSVQSNPLWGYRQKGIDGAYSREYDAMEKQSMGGGFGRPLLHGVDPWEQYYYAINFHGLDPTKVSLESFIDGMGPTWEYNQSQRTAKDELRDGAIVLILCSLPFLVYGGVEILDTLFELYGGYVDAYVNSAPTLAGPAYG